MTVTEDRPAFVTGEVPLYYQLGTILREKILSGAFAAGEKMPTEIELVDTYGVSRITVRQALKSLEEENLIRREAGRGTFVSSEIEHPGTVTMQGSLEDLISLGKTTEVKLLELNDVVATRRDAELFKVEPGAPVKECRRLRFSEGEPLSYIVNRLPADIADQLADHDWEKGGILQSLERLGLHVSAADQSVRATLADAHTAALLQTRIGAPLLSVDRVVLAEGRCVERVHTYYRGDLYSLAIHFDR